MSGGNLKSILKKPNEPKRSPFGFTFSNRVNSEDLYSAKLEQIKRKQRLRELQVEDKIKKGQSQLRNQGTSQTAGYLENAQLLTKSQNPEGEEYLSDEYEELEQRINDLEFDLSNYRSNATSEHKPPRASKSPAQDFLAQGRREKLKYNDLLSDNLQRKIDQYEEDHVRLLDEIEALK